MNIFAETLLSLMDAAGANRTLAVILLATAIFTVCMTVCWLVVQRFDPMKKRIDTLINPDSAKARKAEPWTEKLEHFQHDFLPQNQSEQKSARDRLVYAGYRDPNNLANYYFIRTSLMIALPVLVLLIYPLLGLDPKKILFYSFLAFTLGMIGPSYILDKKVAARQRLLRNGLPDAIDLLVVCTEAGLGLNAALLRVAEVIAQVHPVLAEELLLVNAEIRAGVDRTLAINNLARRTGLEDIKGLVAVLAQGMRFGISIALTLRAYSDEFRVKRMQKADEEAAKLATKMIFPLVFCIMPGFFIVAIGPAVIKAIAVFSTKGP